MQIGRKKAVISAQETGSKGIFEKGRDSLRETFELFWKKRILVFVLFLLVCFVLSGYYYINSFNTASTIISLDYEEAAKGLTPSQTRFNIFEIESAEVMERLIDYAGLEGQITPDELSKCISVRPTHSKNVSGEVNFISTSFTLKFTNSGIIRGRSAETMLKLLCKAYREFFVEHYGINYSILSFNIDDLKSTDEYLKTVDLLELKCNQLGKYVQLRMRENKNYQDPDTGLTFSALEQQVNNFYTYDLVRLRSYIIENGIANDKPELSSTLDYKNRMDRLQYDKLIAAYEEDNKGIKMYDVAMSSVIMIPTEDRSQKYYMSRTKTGMDNMALHADGQLYSATEKLQEIEYNTYLIRKMQTNSPLVSQREKADDMILQMEASLESLASDIRRVDKEYTSYKARNYLSFSSSYQRFMERIEPVNAMFGAVVLFAAVFTIIFLRHFLKKGKAA